MPSILIFLLLISQVNLGQEYIAKRGDSVTVTVWDRQSLSGTIMVDPNGNITLPMPIGAVSVLGMTATQIGKILTDKIKEYQVNPTVFVSISPAEGFTVHVLGEVRAPDFVRVPEGTTVQEAITRAGGWTDFADKENIRLIREESEIDKKTTETKIDFTKFIKGGDLSANPVLKSRDVLIVPRAAESVVISKRISVYGAVGRPGLVETEEPQALSVIIAMSGGFTYKSVPSEISIVSISDEKFLRKSVNFEDFLTGKDVKANPIISFGEMVFVPEKPEKIDEKPFEINVMGQITRPGAYPANSESRLLGAIYQAGGFAEESDIEDILLIRNENGEFTKKKVNIKEFILSGNVEFNPLLVKGDIIYVPLSSKAKQIPTIHEIFLPTMQISIIGEISKPDTYNVSDNAGVLDILKLAGGPANNAELKKVVIIRKSAGSNRSEPLQEFNLQRILTKGELESLPKLITGDTIFIPRKEETSVWGTIVRKTSEIYTITTVILTIYLLIDRLR
ncbi:MAG: SLBB domain-containing protein [Candidatus Poribacteria bacterium]